ncbi:NADP-dependent oxidoreductase [Streptomyces rapamycinicus]|uniref:NADPH:quinone reductase n=2 Tax=Streptomyces rapamycinicus TaxID=1226757 RepID=A0A0A0NQZ3_STRRN|nr:NADP-dependent oxidoreductase [Streptomyces rapamycinicus]AGP58673.1 NADPH:quinone reductase [Streptomyces rapamycinicus NRRL 5491]MBB4786386.1 NADPH:quinone reductase-like Zn-dependent oxidoreductase [Streptomyces rapamycinicus]RLV78154.1 NADPH:quinone reductase [Streptomyces rapamycinicus NRRL 5491]UTO66482.1 NADP-dependent oxidoreductase [Streptomyces rapamycinicus]UTP34436.1 NADP-dependent oxidoreductase [Streptomyces rapamycinicus NRRL 5491]
MTTAKRIQYHQYGGPEVLRLEDFQPARPGPGEVLVRMRAAAANPMDWKIRSGGMKMLTGRSFPRGLGHDFAGVIEAVGDGVTRLGVGDEVLGGAPLKTAGAFAEMIVAEAKGVVKKPADLSFEDAAVLPTVGITALQALTNLGKLQPGQAVFVHGCLGGVGRAAVQIASMRGASVGGSCRATATRDARDLGIAPIVEFDFDPTTLRGRFDIVFDTAGTLPVKAAQTLLKSGGHIIDITPTPAKFARSALPGPFKVLIAQAVTKDLEEVARAAGQGTLRLPIARTVPLTQAIAALTEFERGIPKGGKLVITTG